VNNPVFFLHTSPWFHLEVVKEKNFKMLKFRIRKCVAPLRIYVHWKYVRMNSMNTKPSYKPYHGAAKIAKKENFSEYFFMLKLNTSPLQFYNIRFWGFTKILNNLMVKIKKNSLFFHFVCVF